MDAFGIFFSTVAIIILLGPGAYLYILVCLALNRYLRNNPRRP